MTAKHFQNLVMIGCAYAVVAALSIVLVVTSRGQVARAYPPTQNWIDIDRDAPSDDGGTQHGDATANIKKRAPSNQIQFIEPYWSGDTWVFDDARLGLVKEPFISGVPEMISELAVDIPDATQGFRLLFSGASFPDAHRFDRTRLEDGGAWYRDSEGTAEGWLCPSLLLYFDEAPKSLYVKAEPK